MKRRNPNPLGSNVDDWLKEEDARSPGFLDRIDCMIRTSEPPPVQGAKRKAARRGPARGTRKR